MHLCAVCESDNVVPALAVGPYAMARCRVCRHVFVCGGVDSKTLEAAYDAGYYAAGPGKEVSGYEDYLGNSRARMGAFQERLTRIEALLGRRGKVLDYGCAVGLFLKVAEEAGWHAVGYERSAWAANYGRDQFGLEIVHGNGETIPAFGRAFDAVTMWDVLEHVEHPRMLISWLSNCLKPGGLLALNTVNVSSLAARLAGRDWRHLAPPHHLQFFSRQSLNRLLREHGLRVVRRIGRGAMFGAGRTPKLSHAANACEAIVTHWRLRRLVTALDVLDEIEIIAVRQP